MKTKLKIIIFSAIALIMLILGLVFAINYKKETIKYFYDSGYVINNAYDDKNLNKIYFESNTPYESKGDSYTFRNSDGDKITISEDSFIHYGNGSVMALKDGVAIDLDKIDSKLISYYNVFASSVLKKTSSGYEINNLNDIISFDKLMYKISNNKYLIAADNIVISFSDDQTVTMNAYAEIEYVNDKVIKIYNEEVNYQTIASNLFVVVDNIKIDLEYKTISKKDVKYLTMADMVINAEDNIEVLPELPEPIKENDNGDNNNNNNNTNTNNGNNTQNNIDNENNSEITDELNTIQLPEQNEEIDTEDTFIQPKFTVENLDVTTLGFQSLVISAEDQSSALYGDRTVEIIENSTGKVVEPSLKDWPESSQSYTHGPFFGLKPNTAYTLNVVGQYKIDDVIYDRIFVSKIFRTLDIGLEIEKDYATSKSLSFAVYRNSYSEVNGFTYSISDLNGQVIVEDKTVSYSNSDLKILTEENVFSPNTEYELTIKNIKYGNAIFSTQSYEDLKLTYRIKTLKENPVKKIELDYKVDSSNNTIRFGLKNINDNNGGIQTYTYRIYNNRGDLEYSTIKDKYSDLVLNIADLGQGDTFYYNVEIAFDDNEKIMIYKTDNSNPITTGKIAYPQVVEFKSFESEENPDVVVDSETLFGEIIIDDKDNYIGFNEIQKYRVIINEKTNPTITSEQVIDITTQKNGSRFSLPVEFKKLKPDTEYIMSVKLVYEGGDIYIGYATAKTKQTDPIILNLKDFNEDKLNLFAYKVYKNEETASLENVKSIKFELLGCDEDDKCSILDKNNPYSRTIPENQGSTELDELRQAEGYVDVKSSEFEFYLQNYNSDYAYYKVSATALAELGYPIPVKINDISDENSSKPKNINENEFVVTILDMPPTLEITPEDILKQDCLSESLCENFYRNKTDNDLLEDDTIVGYNFKISTAKSSINNYVIKPIHYAIYEKSDTECSENVPEKNSSLWIDRTLSEFEETAFVPVRKYDQNETYIMRGKTYCVAYYGEYKDSKDNNKESDMNYFEIFSEKQPAKIKGYVKSYTGTSITFNLDVTDIDSSIKKIYFNDGINEITPTISGNSYTFDSLINGKDYPLLLNQNLGKETKTYNIYNTKLDEVYTYPDSIKVIVDSSNVGKIVFKVPYESIINKDYVAALLIGTKKIDLIDDSANEIMYADINLSDITDYGLEIDGRTITINNADIKILYDNGMIDRTSDELFIKSITELSTSKYYNKILNNFSTISKSNIFSRNLTEDILIMSKIKPSEFSSKIETSTIGEELSPDDSIPRFVHLNKVNKTNVVLYDGENNPTNTFVVNQTLSTSEINSKQTSSGSKELFNIVSSIKENTEIKIELKRKNDELVVDWATINLGSKVVDGDDSSDKIKNISYNDNNNQIFIEFYNLADSEYLYSILYKDASTEGEDYIFSYNNHDQDENKDIVVSELKKMVVTGTSAIYNKSGWKWNSDGTDIYFTKDIKYSYKVDTTKYELLPSETIKYDLVAINTENPDETVSLVTDAEIDNSKSNTIDDIGIINELSGTYSIVMYPKIFNDDTKTRDLAPEIIKSQLIISKEGPYIAVNNDGTPQFAITMNDENGVLLNCPGVYDASKPVMAYASYEDDKNKNYYELSTDKRKVVYFELFDNNNESKGYTPIPFTVKTTPLNLYNYFEEKGLKSGIYYLKITYCKLGSSEPINMITDLWNIRSKEEFNIYKLPGVFNNTVMLVFKNPPSEIDDIYHIHYQYKANGSIYSRDLYQESLIEDNKFSFVVTYSGDDTLYYLGLPVEKTISVSDFTISFKDSNDKVITYY